MKGRPSTQPSGKPCLPLSRTGNPSRLPPDRKRRIFVQIAVNVDKGRKLAVYWTCSMHACLYLNVRLGVGAESKDRSDLDRAVALVQLQGRGP